MDTKALDKPSLAVDFTNPNEVGSGSISSTGQVTSTAISNSLAVNSGLSIHINWDASVKSAPGGFTTGVMAAVNFLESQFHDPVTVNINVGYGEVDGDKLGNALGGSVSFLRNFSYAQMIGALQADETTAADRTAVPTLPPTSPVNGTYWVTTAQAKALGLASPNSAGIDGYIGFSAASPFDYDNTNGVSAGTHDFAGTVLHEITEVMGRMLGTGSSLGSAYPHTYNPYDLFHYSAPGVRDFSASVPGYFSVDGGKTNLAAFNTNPVGDAGDWASSVKNDAADAFSTSGVVNAFSQADVTAIDVIGWDASGASSQDAGPTAVALAAATHSLRTAISSTGVNSGVDLVDLHQVGGPASDGYIYVLGGAAATTFSAANSGGAGQLMAAGAGLSGAPGGKLYALTITAKDLNSGLSAPADPFNIVVGTSSRDTISVANLAGSGGSSTPTFLYGLAGADTIDGSGMTGPLWFDGGTGGDVMAGGSGPNHYLYGPPGDSRGSATDLITNFHPALDLLDFSGIGSALNDIGTISGTTVSAHSVGWQASGGNTFVYVNTGSLSANLSAASMAVELKGSVALTSNNIIA